MDLQDYELKGDKIERPSVTFVERARMHVRSWVVKAGRPVFRLAWIVFFLSLIATLLAWRLLVTAIDDRAQEAFDDLLLGFAGELERSVSVYEETLAGAAALIHTRPTLTRAEFKSYLDALNIERRYSGVQGVGYAAMFAPEKLSEIEEAIRTEGFPDFEVKPKGQRDTYSAIIFLEPFDWRNQRAFGYDMFSEPTRREAMERARDTGKPAASGTVLLVQETEQDVQQGFLLYRPIYDVQKPPETVAERRAHIKGFVYSPFRVRDLIKAVLDRERMQVRRNAEITIAAPGNDGNDSVIYSTLQDRASGSLPNSAFKRSLKANVHGVPWSITLYSTPAFEDAIDYRSSRVALGAGVLLCIVFSGLVASIMLRQEQTDAANARMQLLSRELAHRVKNTLAVIQSIATRSLVDGRPLDVGRKLFLERLHALARAHTQLLDASWNGVSMKSLALGELRPFGARARVTGPDVMLNANAAQMFALVMHELATNASKHGALSVPEGRVDINWKISGERGSETVHFRWKESNGPVVEQPESRGFGETLLGQSLAPSAGEPPEVAYEPDGLRYEFQAPLSGLANTSAEDDGNLFD